MSQNLLKLFEMNKNVDNEETSDGKAKSNRTSHGGSVDDGGPIAHTASFAVAEALKKEYRERLQAAAAKEAEHQKKMEEAKAAR